MGGWGLKNIFLFAQALAAKGGWRLIKTYSLWTRVIKQKYFPLESIEHWIRNPRKTHTGGSVIWKAVVKSFSLIETNLSWDVGNGEKLQVGRNPWVGSEQQHFLPVEVINTLALRGILTLSQLANERPADPWIQHWKSAEQLGLGEQEVLFYENYIRGLQTSHIQLSE